MRNCKKCGQFIQNDRIHLGYKECTKCSNVEQYSAHIVYPHKTGGYVQPVTKETKESLQGLDRRSVKTGKIGKSTSSWDRWLKQYWHDKYNPKPKKKRVVKVIRNDYMNTKEAFRLAYNEYDKFGYQSALDLLQKLYTEDKISLVVKSKLVNELVGLRMMTTKERKFFAKMQNNS